jgi:hypothetical protein
VLVLLAGFWHQMLGVVSFQGAVIQPRLYRFSSATPTAFRTANPPTFQPSRCRRRAQEHRHRMTLDKLNDVQEEMLMCVQMQWMSVADLDPDQTEAFLLDYVRSFPFAAVLPVQPLTYLPTPGGVDVTFLRKKTATKPTNDGGIRLVLEPVWSASEQGADAEGTPATSWILTARRNSEGQSVQKLFSEKLIVQELLDGLTGASQRFAAAPATTTSAGHDATTRPLQPRDVVQVTSVYHKWMSERK